MTNFTVARRYAQALYQEAAKEGATARVDEDVALILESVEGSRELSAFFASPVISRQKKEAVIRQLFEPRVSPLSFRFMMLMLEKGREEIFPAVAQAYQQLRNEQLGVVQAQVRSAQTLGAEEQAKLAASVERMTGKRVRLQAQVDPSLIGGVVVRVGDTVYDGSFRHQLELLRERLERSAVVPTV